MGLIDLAFSLFAFLSSFLGTLILALAIHVLLGESYTISLVIGLAITTLTLLITRTKFSKIHRFSSFAKSQGVSRKQRQTFKKALQNKFFSGHIARAFLLAYIFFSYDTFLLIPLSIFCVLVIFSMMRLRHTSLIKIILSAFLGTISGVIGVILSNMFI